MITIIFSTHKDELYNNNFKEHLTRTVGLKDVQILQFQNNNQYSLSEVYNRGIKQSDHNIVVCLHNDVKLEKNWGKKLLKDFFDNPDYGIIGKAGTAYFPESGIYWERLHQTMVGQVYHHPPNSKKFLSKYSEKVPHLIPVVSIDGLFISFDKTKVKHFFDETIGRFHFYDHPFSLSNYLDGIKIGVTSSFDITHESVGQPNDEFFRSKESFLNIYLKNLPIDLKPTGVYFEPIKSKLFKNTGKVAVIIPTKGKLNLLFDCINSYIEHVVDVNYEIFVADTGSSESEKIAILNYIETNMDFVKIHFIQYDYYNFAKINNDVVKNYITEDFEFIVFCNNDIKLLNNVVYGMVKTFITNPKAGTVGARLHFEDNTIQHDGIITELSERTKNFKVGHKNFKSYYNFTNSITNVVGNTAGLLMIRRNVFNKINGFNESYRVCFEDVELNLQCIISGLTNIYNGTLVAYHYESQTRKNDDDEFSIIQEDYSNILVNFVVENLKKINKTQTWIKPTK